MDQLRPLETSTPKADVNFSTNSKSTNRAKPYDLTASITSSSYSPIIKSLSKTSSDDLSKYSYSSMCIRKTAIDWRLVKKEAEAIKLRTENLRLQGLLRANNEELEKSRIEHKKQLDEHNLKAVSMQTRASNLEEQINELKNNLSALNIDKAQSEKTLREEVECTEKRLTECQINDVKLRSRIVDLEEEVKRTVLKNEHNNNDLQHQVASLKNALEAANREKELYMQTVMEHRDKIQLISTLENKITELEDKNRQLEKTINDLKDGKSMSFILDNELRELARLRLENDQLVNENNKLKEIIQATAENVQKEPEVRPHKIPRGRCEIVVEEITDSQSARTSQNDSLIQVEYDDEVSVSETMDNSELEIEPVEDMEASTSPDKARPPQRRGVNEDQEESLDSASDGSEDAQDIPEEGEDEEEEEEEEEEAEQGADDESVDEDNQQDNHVDSAPLPQRAMPRSMLPPYQRMTLAPPTQHLQHESSEESSNQSESEDGEADSESGSCTGSDDSDIQEIE